LEPAGGREREDAEEGHYYIFINIDLLNCNHIIDFSFSLFCLDVDTDYHTTDDNACLLVC
jgi:hypothetical protein